MRSLLQALLFIGGLSAILVALLHIVLGPAAIPGGVVTNATMDSEDRFYATLFLVFGIFTVWCARGVEMKTHYVVLIASVLFFGGIARCISMAVAGIPHRFFVAMTAVELLLPVVLYLLARDVPVAKRKRANR